MENMYGGIFSYIEDEVTAISYRHSGNMVDYKIGTSHFSDYSKNWRQLLYIDTNTNAFVASRQYPTYNEEISKQVREMLEKIISDKLNIENTWKRKTIESGSTFENYLEDIETECGALHYNDMLHGYKGDLIWNKELDNLGDVHMFVGSEPICPICGERTLRENDEPTCHMCYREYLD